MLGVALLIVAFGVLMYFHVSLLVAPVTRIVDGDTFRADVNGKNESIRIHGINAPEKDEYGFQRSSDALSALISGKEVKLKFIERDKYGRMVCDVFVNGIDVADVMISSGYAKPYTFKHRRSKK